MLQMGPANHKELMEALEYVPAAWVTIVTVDPTPCYLQNHHMFYHTREYCVA